MEQKKDKIYTPVQYLLFIGSFMLGIVAKKPLEYIYRPITTIEPVHTRQITTSAPDGRNDNLFSQASQAYNNNQINQAFTLFQRSLKSNQNTLTALIGLGNCLTKNKHYKEALSFFRATTLIEPGLLSSYVSAGMCSYRLGKYQEALHEYNKVLKLSPEYADAHQHIAKTLSELGQFDKAINHAQRAVSLQPHNIHTHLNLGHVHNKKGDLAQAIDNYKKALEINPNFANAQYNLGYTLKLQGDIQEAIKHLKKAIELKPNYVDPHIALSHAYWVLGDYEKAWEEYEWRWKMYQTDPRPNKIPFWDGSPLNGKTILLYSEQGLGDTLQFVRYAKYVKERGGNVYCKIQKPLKNLLANYPYIDKIITGPMDDHIDVQAPLMSLPGILKTTPETIPAEIPYLQADNELIDSWKKKIDCNKGMKVGLCWHVDPIHDIDKSPVSKRSVPVKLFQPLSQLPNLTFYGLQKGEGEEQLANLPKDFKLYTFGLDFDTTHGSFMDSAAVIANLDLVISVDTSIAHVAAAMGKEVWMLLPYSPDCRWALGTQTTAWYPTMRLFRQEQPFDWEHVIEKIKTALQEKIRT